MSKQRPASAAVRGQIVAALHGAYPRALTTRELADQLPPVVVSIHCDCRSVGCERADAWTGECRILECHPNRHVIRRPRRPADIHRHLVALARAGEVIQLGHNRQASQAEPWTVEPDAAALQEIAELERCWADG